MWAWNSCYVGIKRGLPNEIRVENGLEPNRIWARVLAFNYCGGGNILQQPTPTLVPRHSSVYRGLMEQWRFVKENVAMVLGDRWITHFWLNQWAEPSSLLIFTTQYLPAAELEKRVNEH